MISADGMSTLRAQYGTTALHYAAREGHASVVDVLVAAGADVRAQTKVCEKHITRRCCARLPSAHLLPARPYRVIALRACHDHVSAQLLKWQ